MEIILGIVRHCKNTSQERLHDTMKITYNPLSETIVFSSRAMYCTGVPFGGVSLSCTRDLMTSRARDDKRVSRQDLSRAHLTDSRRANMISERD